VRIAPRALLDVDASPNGGVAVHGEERTDVLLFVKVVATAESDAEAKALAQKVTVQTDGTIRGEGPATGRHAHWWTSFRIAVPRHSNLALRTENGGISIERVTGEVEFRSQNGGIQLSELAGNVKGRTTNGGLKVALSGSEWSGDGLDVQTTNGGVALQIPKDYNAHLETGTVNGGIRLGFPVSVQGRIDKKLSVDLGRGGKTVRVVTTNGGVRVDGR
jgi:hypothetical protein